MTQDLTDADILAILRQSCAEAGSQQAWAEQNNISPAYISKVLNGREDVTGRILDALGYESIGRRYRKKKD